MPSLNQPEAGQSWNSAPAEALREAVNSHEDSFWRKIFLCARETTEKYFSRGICFFAPLYFSSYCVNDCVYCGFRKSNSSTHRTALSREEFLQEAKFLWNEGHRSLLLIAGEHPKHSGVEVIVAHTEALKQERLDFSVAVEVGPLETEEYRALKRAGVNRCILFQETYDPARYESLHTGPKQDYAWRYEALERALSAGISHVGLGILLGVGPFQEDWIQMILHARDIQSKFGCGPASVSLPRLRTAQGVAFKGRPVTDEDFKKLIALTRLALPSTGIILSTREHPVLRREILELGIGVTHLSAGVSTSPGGYTLQEEETGQFDIHDERSLAEVIKDVSEMGYQAHLHKKGWE